MEFRLLGPISVTDRGRPVALGGPTSRAVLALLLRSAGRVVTPDQLIDDLWGEEPPRTALATVRTYVSRLRGALAAQADARPRLSSEGAGYVIRVEPGELDARTFETAAVTGKRLMARGEWASAADTLRAALDLWRGPALAGLEGFRGLSAEATRLEELRLGVLEDRLESDVAMGRHAEATPELERFLADQPYRERAWGQLMLALYRSGRQADALRAYQRARARLGKELGLEPGSELRRLELAILRQDSSLERTAVRLPEAQRLPVERTSLIGRDTELEHLDHLLAEARMVTLTGIGGSGKTRLALRAARSAAPRYPDGVWWVGLASITDPRLVAHQAAAAVGVTAAESKAHSVAEVLVEYLSEKEGLLVLDNCEHLADAAAGLVDTVLKDCARLKVLATSRATLGVAGEVTVPVQPLEVPRVDADNPGTSPAVRLFLERARSVVPSVAADAAGLERIAEICRELEGIPLGIELAAALVKILSPAAIAARLKGHLDLLAGGPRTALPRHRSLRATLDWSFDLLDREEQRLLRCVSVFVGGFSLDAVIAVAGDDSNDADPVLQRMVGLVDHSLVETYPQGRSIRYRLLEPVREYAAERLGRETDADLIRSRHAAYFLRLALDGDRHLREAGQETWLATLDTEHPNLRAAMGWALDAGQTDLALQLIAALGWYWFMRGHWSECRPWLDRALASPGGSPLHRAQAIYRAGGLEIIRVKRGDMPTLVRRALATCRRENDRWGTAWCLHLLGQAAMYQRTQPRRAATLLRKAVEAFAEIGDTWAHAWTLRYAALGAEEDVARSLALQQEATEQVRALGDLWLTAFFLFGLGSTLTSDDRHAEARSAFQDGLDLCRAVDDQVMAAHNLRGLGLLSLLEADRDAAAALFEEARATFQRAGDENCHGLCSLNLAVIHLDRRNIGAARRDLAVAVADHRSIGRDDGLGQALVWLAAVDLAEGNLPRAAVLIGASRWREGLGVVRNINDRWLVVGISDPVMRTRIEQTEAEIRERLGPGVYKRTTRDGRRMPREEALRVAFEEHWAPAPYLA